MLKREHDIYNTTGEGDERRTHETLALFAIDGPVGLGGGHWREVRMTERPLTVVGMGGEEEVERKR